MKEVSAQVGRFHNRRVQLHQYAKTDRLTPKMARAAAEIAFGAQRPVTVCDDADCYRVSESGTRKL